MTLHLLHKMEGIWEQPVCDCKRGPGQRISIKCHSERFGKLFEHKGPILMY